MSAKILWAGLTTAMICILAPGMLFSGPISDSSDVDLTELLPTCGKAVAGEAAPWLSGWTLDDQVFNIRKALADEATDRLALVFWATWCLPCRDGLERLTKAAEDLAAGGVAVVLVNVGEQREKILEFFGEKEPPFPVTLDPYQNSGPAYLLRPDGKQTLPLTAVINKAGEISKLLGAEGSDYIQQILAED